VYLLQVGLLKTPSCRFQHFLVVDGTGSLVCGDEVLPVKKGSSVFVPAGSEAFYITGECSVIITFIE
jgi:mannose-6-phosphate isomerase